MTVNEHDRAIERAMAELRVADTVDCPTYAHTLSAARARRAHAAHGLARPLRRTWLGLGAAAAAGAVIALVVLLRASAPPAGPATQGRAAAVASPTDVLPAGLKDAVLLASSAWVGPLDPLLDVPAADMLVSTLRFGSPLPAFETWEETTP